MKTRIRQARKAANLTQKELASNIKLSENYIFMIERGDREPPERTLEDIAAACKCNLDWLRTGQGEMYSLDAVEKQTAELLGHAITHNTTAKDGFLRAIAATDEKTLQAVLDFMARVAEEIKAK